MNGIEMMIVNILQGIGIDPNELMQKANALIEKVETSLESFDARLGRIEKALNILDDEEVKQKLLSHDEKISEAMHERNK